MTETSFFQLKTKTLEGEPMDFAAWQGKVVVVVNVASRCGFTPQYEGLEKLWKEYKDRGVMVVGFPSNDFAGQEPGTAEEIRQFCSLNYGVSFPLMEKVVVKAGPEQSPVYRFLAAGAKGESPGWNFGKYLIGKDGKVVSYFSSRVTPESPELRGALEQALKK